MPRTDAVTAPGCAPLRALSFDNLGLIKVVESSTENAHPQVVARWGEPNPQKSIVAASFSSDEDSQVLAVARKNFHVEILDPCSGAMYTELNVLSTSVANGCVDTSKTSKGKESAALIGVHLLRTEASGLRSVLTCTDSGTASIQRFSLNEAELNCSEDECTSTSWSVCKAGNILCMKVDKSENYAAFGGDGADVTVWDLKTHRKFWEAKAPRRDSNGLMSPAFVTASTFLGNDHRKLIIGTGHHQVRLYDICAQRRPMIAFDFLESPIKAVEADTDGYTIFVGTGNGDLASFDMRSGKLLGSFKGKVSGSIRSIAVHPTLPIFATCGLDRFLRVFHKGSRQLLTRVFLKQPLVMVVFDGKYPTKLPAPNDATTISEGKSSSVTELCKGEGQEYSHKKSKKSLQTQNLLLETENDTEHASEKIYRKRKLGKDLAGEQPLKVHKKKRGGSSNFAHMHEGDRKALAKEDAKPTQGKQDQAVIKLKRRKKQKNGVAA